MGGGCFYEQPLATPSFLEEINEYNCSFAETSATAIPMCDAPDLSKLPRPGTSFASSRLYQEQLVEFSSFVKISSTSDIESTDANETLPVGDFEDGSTRDRLEAAERRVRALIDAMQPGTIKDMWTTTTQVVDEQPKAPSPCNISENPAGVIGSPVKGKGGIYGRQQTPGQTWQC
ncbi:hypothetical protein Q1695_013210 [Nippostrongylus brasiliensis]|nr:hypothetical protein Q1695_013210 [Nippostrongylus brasiliensis]